MVPVEMFIMELSLGFSTVLPLKGTNKIVRHILKKILDEGRFIGTFYYGDSNISVETLYVTWCEYNILRLFKFEFHGIKMRRYKGHVFRNIILANTLIIQGKREVL